MTYLNGNGRESAQQLREQAELQRARNALLAARAEAHVLESFLPYQPGYGELVDVGRRNIDPRTGERWRDFGAPGGGRLPEDWSPDWHAWQRDCARDLLLRNRFAVGIVEALQCFAVRIGYDYRVEPNKAVTRYEDPRADELARMAQQALDEFSEANDWPGADGREGEILRRAVEDGECFQRHLKKKDGGTLVRFIEPEDVRQPDEKRDCRNWSWGVVTHPRDVETVLGYAHFPDPDRPDHWVGIKAESVTHLKRNVVRTIKRGISDFFCTEESLREVAKLSRNMVVGGAVSAAVPWYEQYEPSVSAEGIHAAALAMADLRRPNVPDPVSGRDPNPTQFPPGSIRHLSANKKVVPGPLASNTANYVSIEQAGLRSAGVRWQMPEFLVSGDASNNNFASALVAGGPFTVRMESEQDKLRKYYLKTMWLVLRRWAEAGRFRVAGRRYEYADLRRLLTIAAEPPQVAIANRAEEAGIDLQDVQAKVVSRRTVRQKRGYDPEEEARQIAEEGRQGLDGQQQGGGMGGLLGEGEAPCPACRGKALREQQEAADKLGDVADILAHLYGEEQALRLIQSIDVGEGVIRTYRDVVRLMEEGFTGEKKNKLGHRICYKDGKRVACPKKEKEAGPKKKTIDDARREIKAARDNPTPRGAFELAQTLQGLTNADLASLKREMGVRGGGRRKDELVNALRDKLFPEGGAKKEEPAPKAEPEPAPARPKAAPKAKPAGEPGKAAADAKAIHDDIAAFSAELGAQRGPLTDAQRARNVELRRRLDELPLESAPRKDIDAAFRAAGYVPPPASVPRDKAAKNFKALVGERMFNAVRSSMIYQRPGKAPPPEPPRPEPGEFELSTPDEPEAPAPKAAPPGRPDPARARPEHKEKVLGLVNDGEFVHDVGELRARSGLKGREFDDALVALASERKLHLHQDDDPDRARSRPGVVVDGKNVYTAVTPAGKAAPAPAPKAEKPAGKGVVPAGAVKAAYDELKWMDDYSNGLVAIPHLMHEMRKKNPGLTQEQIHGELKKMADRGDIDLHVLNEVGDVKDGDQAIWEDDRLYYYVRFR